MDWETLLEGVREIALRAGDYLKSERVSISRDQIEIKGQGDFVSRADRNAEELLRKGLTELIPGSVVMAEEGSPEARGGEWRWIVDPLDGTANYLAGLPIWCVSIALEDRRENPERFGPRVLGVVHAPLLETTWTAIRGGGTFRNGKRVFVREPEETSRALLATAFPFKERKRLSSFLDLFSKIYMQIGDVRRAGSAAIDLAWTSDGTFNGYFEAGLNPWDAAAGVLLVEEAGGTVTDWWGSDPLETGWVISGAPGIYRLVREAAQELEISPPERRLR